MIKYKLICKDCNNIFDSWFSNSKEYEKLKKRKYLNCHFCDSKKVEKTLMAPNVFNSSDFKKKDINKIKEIKSKLREFKKFIKDNFQYVGDNFAYEARSIHYNSKKKSNGIYGSASKQDLKELKEEGIDAQMIPWIEDKDN